MPAHESTIACLFIAVETCEPHFATQHGLVPLDYPEEDVRLLVEDFRSLGLPADNIFVLVNEQATRHAILSTLESLGQHLLPADSLFVFISAHGVGSTTETSEVICYSESLRVDELLQAMGRTAASRAILFLDTCHSGNPGAPQFVIGSDSLEIEGAGLAWISSAHAEERACESQMLGHGVFTHFLSQVLRDSNAYDRDRDAWLDFEEVASAVKTSVVDWTSKAGYQQNPHYGLVHWRGSSRMLPVRRDWNVEVLEARHTSRVRVTFPRDELAPGDRLWLAVVSLVSGRYYPQPQTVIDSRDDQPWEGVVYLGTPSGLGIGERFRIVLVHADESLHRLFWYADHTAGLVDPPLSRLLIRAEVTVVRER